jgi:hypothetical protein
MYSVNGEEFLYQILNSESPSNIHFSTLQQNLHITELQETEYFVL